MPKPIFSPFADKKIKNIIFDLGGVIINIDYHLTINAFKALGLQNFDTIFNQAKQIGVFDLLDKGLIAPQEFRNEVRRITSSNLTDEQIDKAWNAMLLDFPPSRLELLRKVKSDYNTFLLSNTNAIHFEAYNQILHRTFGVKNLSVFFDREYYSHLIHMRKPDANAFELILNENNLKPEETLFIDDTMQHVEGAKKIGILAHHLNIPNGDRIEMLFT
ncbi:MAG: HAD family phosphatase [Bacteroidales bacterium]|nr:HAD family phosphatase [Bacteroidales bacterium]MDY0198616.1 HAD family phosphatase [Tenuifilaceae bacterium]